jgi:hypothetical protein
MRVLWDQRRNRIPDSDVEQLGQPIIIRDSKTAITEYNWGDEANLNGATTEANVLGIFGQQGSDIATRWTVPLNPSPTYLTAQI